MINNNNVYNKLNFRNLKIACAIDAESADQILRGKVSTHAARCDQEVVEKLKAFCPQLSILPIGEQWSKNAEQLQKYCPDIVLNLALSGTNLEAEFAAGLNLMGLRFTGSDSLAIALSNDKALSRWVLAGAGLRVPDFVRLDVMSSNISHSMRVFAAKGLRPPYFVKPLHSAGSRSISKRSLVTSMESALAQANKIYLTHGEIAVCDQYIDGREFKVTYVEDLKGTFQFAGASEWLFPDGIPRIKTARLRASSEAKLAVGVKVVKPLMGAKLAQSVRRAGNSALKALGIRGYGSLDLRIDEEERVWIIEVNANPGISSDNGLFSNPSFEQNLKSILRAAYR